MIFSVLKLLDMMVGRERPADPTLWHRWETLLPTVRLTNGRFIDRGALWRRLGPNGWEYRQDEETAQEMAERW